MSVDRLRNAATSFGLSYLVGYAIGRVLGGGSTGKRAGLLLGGLAALASWQLSGEVEPLEFEDADPIEIEIDE
jgi:hypothetical protein